MLMFSYPKIVYPLLFDTLLAEEEKAFFCLESLGLPQHLML